MSEIVKSVEELRATRFAPRRVSWVIGLCFVVIGAIVLMAVLGTLLAPQDPGAQDIMVALSDPSGAHWLGTDALGRDIFSRLVAGARSAFVGPLVVTVTSLVLGSTLGLLAGYRQGWVDSLVMRWVDLMFAIPSLLVIIVLAGAFGGGYWFAVGLLIVLMTPFDTRVVRGAVLEQTPRPYVDAAKTLGVPDRRIMALHIWPNISAVVFANTFLVFAGALVALSSLSFLGVGIAPGTPDWGLMLAENRALLFTNPVAVLAPGAMIVLTATAMALVGDWLYEMLASKGATR